MSNVNVKELTHGTLDPGGELNVYYWDGNYDEERRRVAAFTIVPDPAVPIGDGITVDVAPGQVQVEIRRTWNTVWSNLSGNQISHVFQRNVNIYNPGPQTSAFHLLKAETDN